MKAGTRAGKSGQRQARQSKPKRRRGASPKEEPIEVPERNRAALALLEEWLADESGYDEETWPKLKKALEEDRLGERRLFSD